MASSLPTERPAGRPFDPPAELAALRERAPLSRLSYPDGHEGWLVTGHALVREVLADRRLSARSELRHMPIPGFPAGDQPAPPGVFTGMDAPDHPRYRRLLTGQFTARRMRRLAERIKEVTDQRLDAMERDGGPVDLVAAFAQPIPAQVICELLGVPYEDTPRFQRYALDMVRLDLEPERFAAAFAAMSGYLRELIAAKRAEPTDDLLSGLLTTDLDDDELTNIGFVLFGAGLDTTANMLALGVFALLEHPEQLAALRADPGLAEGTVEELLRYLSIIPFTLRTALEDLELGGELIKAGQTITISIPAADRDPARFADPDTLDLTRPANSHVAFGHGVHQCLGQQLARVELQVALPALFARFPTLRLAVPPEEVPLRADMLIYGVHGLPVTWD